MFPGTMLTASCSARPVLRSVLCLKRLESRECLRGDTRSEAREGHSRGHGWHPQSGTGLVAFLKHFLALGASGFKRAAVTYGAVSLYGGVVDVGVCVGFYCACD